MPEVAVSVAAALKAATERLGAAGCETPRLDAEVLLAHALGCDRGSLVMRSREALDQPAAGRFERLMDRRVAREPVAYITGKRDFRWISLTVDPRVLIPRPETELLVEAALSLPARARVVDVGCGSGAVALALKHERPDLKVHGVDVSDAAVAVARANASRLGLEVEFAVGDLLEGFTAPVDAVLANLPYVPVGETLAPEISAYEPALALFAGPDGLDLIRALVGQLQGISLAAFEVGAGQAGAVAELLRESGFARVDSHRDLAGIERVVVAQR